MPPKVGDRHEQIKAYIELANDTWRRSRSTCPVFPLRDDMIGMKDAAGLVLYSRSEHRIEDGQYFEQAFCHFHGCMEFSHARLRAKEPVATPLQRRTGRKIVNKAVLVPILGWWTLWDIGRDGVMSTELMGIATHGDCWRVHPEERALARKYFRNIMIVVIPTALAVIVAALYFILKV